MAMDTLTDAAVVSLDTARATTQGPAITAEYVERVGAWMEGARGYDRRDPAAFRRLARFLAYRRQGQSTRGLVLHGPNGNGKTLWLRMFAFCRMVTCGEIARRWIDHGPKAINWLAPPTGYDIIPEIYLPLAIDELGAEPVAMHYGTKCECMVDVLCHRYELYQRHGVRAATYVSTNLTKDEIAARYGARVFSRLCEMCTWVPFTAPDGRVQGSGQ